MQKFMCHCTVFPLFYFEFESNFQVLGRAIYWRVSCEFGGLTFIFDGLIRYQDKVLKSPLIIHSVLILCRSLYFSHVLICSTLYPPGSCSNFETGTLLKMSKGPAKLIANCFFIQHSCKLLQKWPVFVWVSVGVTFRSHHLCTALLNFSLLKCGVYSKWSLFEGGIYL